MPEERRLRSNKPVVAGGCVVIAFEVLLWDLIKNGASVVASSAICVAACAVVLARRLLWRWARLSATAACRFTKHVIRVLQRRQTWQFSLRTLLLFVFVVACLCSWYSCRQYRIREERALLSGKWRMIHENGTPVILSNGQPLETDWSDKTPTVNPFHEPKWVDFRLPGNGLSKGIYRLEGDRLRLSECGPGVERPRSFDDSELRIEPGRSYPPGTVLQGPSQSLWERVPDDLH
ncbi:MAG: hypothetical protein ACLP9L_29720 [Thermoguttaceae bacterium]